VESLRAERHQKLRALEARSAQTIALGGVATRDSGARELRLAFRTIRAYVTATTAFRQLKRTVPDTDSLCARLVEEADLP
jgi:hypothetical protein